VTSRLEAGKWQTFFYSVLFPLFPVIKGLALVPDDVPEGAEGEEEG
jgi:hypothetical protein